MTRRRDRDLFDVKSDVGRHVITPVWLLDKLKSKDVSHIGLALFNVLAKYADWQTREAWPSKQLLADDLSLKVTAVKSALRQLERVGAIEVIADYHNNGSQTSNRYIVHFANPEGVEHDEPVGGSSRRPGGVAQTTGGSRVDEGAGVAQTTPRGSSRRPAIYEEQDPDEQDPKNDRTSAVADASAHDDLEAVFGPKPLTVAWVTQRWNDVCVPAGCRPAKLNDALAKRINARLKEHKSDAWWDAFVARVAASDFLTGHSKTADFVADLNWFMESPKNIEKLMDIGRFDNRTSQPRQAPAHIPANRAPSYTPEQIEAAEQRSHVAAEKLKQLQQRELEAAEAIAAMSNDVRDALTVAAEAEIEPRYRATMTPDAWRASVHKVMVSLLIEGAGKQSVADAAAAFADRVRASRRASA